MVISCEFMCNYVILMVSACKSLFGHSGVWKFVNLIVNQCRYNWSMPDWHQCKQNCVSQITFEFSWIERRNLIFCLNNIFFSNQNSENTIKNPAEM